MNEACLHKLVTSFVLSRMDYCNSLLVNVPNDTITKLQRIQNHAARLVLKKAKRDHVTPLFRKLHWLPLQARIDYKICVLCFKCINKTRNALKRKSSTVPHIFGIRYHLISEKPRVKANLKITLRPTFSSPIFVFEFLLIH